jgi:hypothetical protein
MDKRLERVILLMKNNLAYYVYIENINKRKIEKYNVLNAGIVKEIKERTKDVTEKELSAEVVKHILMYHYWSRCEWEIIVTDWPTNISLEELDRLNAEVEKYKKDYNRMPYMLTINLATEEKIDVYSQILLNWDIFINYLWENLK